MEEEKRRRPLSHSAASAPQRPEPDARTPVQSQYINGDHETIVWGETEMQIKQSHGTDQPDLSRDAGREGPKEAEQWEQVMWPLRPTLCTSASLSFATVQWDMPGSSEETPSLVTGSSPANESDCGRVMSVDSPPPPFPPFEDVNAELFAPGERGEDAGFDPLLLDAEWTGAAFEPCDAEDAQEPTTQEVEDTDDPSESQNEIPLRSDSEEEEELSATPDPPETVDVINTLEEIEDSEDDGDSFVDVRLEEEREEPDVLLTAQANPAEEPASANGVETEETNEQQCEVEEETSGLNVSCTEGSEELQTVNYFNDVDVPVEPLQTADTGLTLNSDQLQVEHLEESQQSDTEDIEVLEWTHEDSTGQTEETEMCKDVDQLAEHELSKAGGEEETELIEAAEALQRIERRELTGKVEETGQESSPSPERSECEIPQMTNAPEEPEEQNPEASEQLGPSQHLDQSAQDENLAETTESVQSEETVCAEAEEPGAAAQQEQMEAPAEPGEPWPHAADTCRRPARAQEAAGSEDAEQAPSEVTRQIEEGGLGQTGRAEPPDHTEGAGEPEGGDATTAVANGERPGPLDTEAAHMNGGDADREMARLLAERLFNLDDIQRVDVVKHLDKDNHFSRAVGEEYLKFFDFSGQTLDQALRSFLKVVILIGETQERERVLQHFACRFHQCNPDSFSSSGAALTLTCAVMLLNTDLHGQNVGKSMSSSKFVSNLDEMNEGTNFSKDLLKGLYNSIKNEPLEWAVDEDELKSSMLLEEDTVDSQRSKANPFLDVPHDKNASVVKEGFIRRKVHADIDGKRTPWGKRGWKTFYGILRGMVLYLQKNDARTEELVNEEVVSVHHSLAEQAADYTKKPHVFRLQTADWRVFLFQASSKVEMNSWISRINLVSALHSSPPFPAAVGSQRKFFRPILPASQSAHTMERQLQSHAGMLESFKADLLYLQENPPEGRKARAKELEEHRVRAEYLQHEISRYETYIQVLEGWRKVAKAADNVLSPAELHLYDKAMCADAAEVDGADGSLKKSLSSPSLAVELAPPTVIKVKRNISERRTHRRTIVPRRNKEA